jgi:hypothetical protein
MRRRRAGKVETLACLALNLIWRLVIQMPLGWSSDSNHSVGRAATNGECVVIFKCTSSWHCFVEPQQRNKADGFEWRLPRGMFVCVTIWCFLARRSTEINAIRPAEMRIIRRAARKSRFDSTQLMSSLFLCGTRVANKCSQRCRLI